MGFKLPARHKEAPASWWLCGDVNCHRQKELGEPRNPGSSQKPAGGPKTTACHQQPASEAETAERNYFPHSNCDWLRPLEKLLQ